MKTKVVYVGIDYHDKMLQVCALEHGGAVLRNRSCANLSSALGDCLRPWAIGDAQVRAALEAGTGAANLADEINQRLCWEVSLAHPGYVGPGRQIGF